MRTFLVAVPLYSFSVFLHFAYIFTTFFLLSKFSYIVYATVAFISGPRVLCCSLPLHSLLKMLSQNFFLCFASLSVSIAFLSFLLIHLLVCPAALLYGLK